MTIDFIAVRVGNRRKYTVGERVVQGPRKKVCRQSDSNLLK